MCSFWQRLDVTNLSANGFFVATFSHVAFFLMELELLQSGAKQFM